MNRSLIVLLVTLFYSCTNDSYKNKDNYLINVGDLVEIYYSTNSCCYYCFSNEEDVKHVKLLERKTIDSGPKDCVGCNYVAAFVFKAESVGVDTIELKNLGATMSCDTNDVVSEKYIIEIK